MGTRFVLIVGLFLFLGAEAFAQRTSRSQMNIGAGVSYFKGNKTDTLAGALGYLVRFQGEMGKYSFFRIMGNFTGTFARGSATFSDDGTEVDLNYLMMAGEFNVGALIVPLVFLKRNKVQPFLGGFGTGHLNNMKFSGTIPDTFPKAENSLYYGFGYQAGVNFYIGKKHGIQITFEQNMISGKLDGATFKLGSLRMFLSYIIY